VPTSCASRVLRRLQRAWECSHAHQRPLVTYYDSSSAFRNQLQTLVTSLPDDPTVLDPAADAGDDYAAALATAVHVRAGAGQADVRGRVYDRPADTARPRPAPVRQATTAGPDPQHLLRRRDVQAQAVALDVGDAVASANIQLVPVSDLWEWRRPHARRERARHGVPRLRPQPVARPRRRTPRAARRADLRRPRRPRRTLRASAPARPSSARLLTRLIRGYLATSSHTIKHRLGREQEGISKDF
jgi:hypothetical protein